MLHIRSLFALALATVVVSAPVAGVAQTRGLGRLTGTVTSEAGEPIADASVKVAVGDGVIERRSDDNGSWVLMGMGKGEFVLEVSKAGFETRRMRLVIERESMQSAPVKISLKKRA